MFSRTVNTSAKATRYTRAQAVHPIVASYPRSAITAQAVVARPSLTPHALNWNMENVILRDLKDHELMIEMVATGICHTDIMVGLTSAEKRPWPVVLGHEGW
jgi:hypothetical protein